MTKEFPGKKLNGILITWNLARWKSWCDQTREKWNKNDQKDLQCYTWGKNLEIKTMDSQLNICFDNFAYFNQSFVFRNTHIILTFTISNKKALKNYESQRIKCI